MSDIGHNSAAYGEQIFTESFVLGDDHKKLFHYVQWQLADYITGTQGMTVDQEGVYMRFLVRLYDRGQAFPDDDRMMARVMGMDMRPWRRIKLQLIDMGKILIKNGSLTNSRFERERQKRAAELRKQAEKTREYWEKKRAEKDTSDELPANFRQTSGELPRKVSRKVAKKVNEINGNNEHPIRHTRESRVQSLEERKEETPPMGSPEGEKPKRKRQFPEGWTPSPGLYEWSRSDKIGATDAQIFEQFEAFRDYHQSKLSRFANWDQAFQTWMRKAKSFGQFTKQKAKPNGSYSYSGNYTGELL